MKIILAFLLAPIICAAQTDFEVVNARIIWTHVFNENVTVEDMSKYLLKEFAHETPQIISNNSISANTSFSAVFIDRGFWLLNDNAPVRFSYTVDFKENRYRVQVHTIVLREINEDDNDAKATIERFIDKDFIRDRDGAMRTNTIARNTLERLHNAFTTRFTFKETDGG